MVISAGLLVVFAACGGDDEGEESPAATTPAADETACEGGPGVTGDGEPLKIGLLVPYTGALATFGPEYENVP
jgi:hypothetical protein